MIHTQILEHAVRLALYSTALEKETPVSLLIVAPPEHGKSEILKMFAFIESLKIMTDFNSHVFADFANEYQAGRVKTLVLPDFLRIVKKKYSTQANSLMILNAITEEGWIGKLPMGQTISEPIKANVLTAITKEEMADKRHKWAKLGFLSRFIPLSFSYTEETKKKIREYIKDRIYKSDDMFDFKLPEKKVNVVLPREFANQLEKITLKISKENNLTGFRLQRQLQVMALSNALANKKTMVDQSDVDVVKQIAHFINFNFTQI